MLNQEILNKIKAHSLENTTKECCGFIVNNIIILKCENVAKFPENNFLIKNEDKNNAEKLGKITHFYHSHLTDLDFSLIDKVVAEKHNIICIKYNVIKESFDFYHPCGFIAPLLNRNFVSGYLDCFSLIQDFYNKELNIKLEDFLDRDNDKFETNLNIWIKNNNFEYTDKLEKYCLIGIKNSDNLLIHCAVYLGDNKIIHQPSYTNSKIEHYGKQFKNKTICILKHELL